MERVEYTLPLSQAVSGVSGARLTARRARLTARVRLTARFLRLSRSRIRLTRLSRSDGQGGLFSEIAG